MPLPSIPAEGQAPTKGTWLNQRATVRYQCPPATPGRVHSGEDHQYHRAWLVDLSTKGVGLHMVRPPAVGTHLTVHLKSTNTGQRFEIAAHVIHVTLQANGEFIVGCEFVTRLSHDDLETLL